MDPASLATGVLALAGLFNNAVECFEFIQLGRNFGGDFQTSLLKLDDGRLEQIQQLFVDAEVASRKLTAPNKNPNIHLQVHDTTDLNSTAAALHNHMRDLADKRLNRTFGIRIRQKARWALYEEKHFTKLIKDVTELVSGLTELFPAAKRSQQQLCEVEVRGITTESLTVLKHAINGQDSILEAAITKTMGDRQDHPPNISISGDNYSGLQLGENKGSMSGFNFHAGKGS